MSVVGLTRDALEEICSEIVVIGLTKDASEEIWGLWLDSGIFMACVGK